MPEKSSRCAPQFLSSTVCKWPTHLIDFTIVFASLAVKFGRKNFSMFSCNFRSFIFISHLHIVCVVLMEKLKDNFLCKSFSLPKWTERAETVFNETKWYAKRKKIFFTYQDFACWQIRLLHQLTQSHTPQRIHSKWLRIAIGERIGKRRRNKKRNLLSLLQYSFLYLFLFAGEPKNQHNLVALVDRMKRTAKAKEKHTFRIFPISIFYQYLSFSS